MCDMPRETKDTGFKSILGDRDLFAQFIRDFVKIDMLKDITPDDIEDITERFTVMGLEHKDGDTVKKVKIKGHEPLFVIGIAEHQQKVNYRMSFRLLQYSVFAWIDYEKEQNALRKGASELKDFKYPPVLPIVYYTGTGKWTAPLNFYDKVHFNSVFERFIPKFEYLLIDSNSYTIQDLLEYKDILSLFLAVDKIKTADQFPILKEIPQEYFDELEKSTPEHLRKLIREALVVFMRKLDVPEEEWNDVANKIKERRFSGMFELLDGYSVTKTRQEGRQEEKKEVAMRMLRRGTPIKIVAEDTDMDEAAVSRLKAEMEKQPA